MSVTYYILIYNKATHLLAVDGLATSSVEVGEVTTLEHELGNDTVEAIVHKGEEC